MEKYIVGIDEVGRGAFAGPVCVGICVIEQARLTEIISRSPFLIRDSKKVSQKRRDAIARYLSELKKQGVLEYYILSMSADKIDTYGIAVCIQKMIEQGLKKITHKTEDVYIKLDGGLYAPALYSQKTIVRGDDTEPVISCASILAKVYRDTYMKKQSSLYPQYGFEQHVGYGTQRHRDAIAKNGLSEIHRKTFCRNSL